MSAWPLFINGLDAHGVHGVAERTRDDGVTGLVEGGAAGKPIGHRGCPSPNNWHIAARAIGGAKTVLQRGRMIQENTGQYGVAL